MRHRRPLGLFTVAAIPYLLLSSSQQAGIVTHLYPDGSGERATYARAAAGRAPEIAGLLRDAMPRADLARSVEEAEGKRVLAWRDGQFADMNNVGEVETTTTGIVQSPMSIYSTHTWKETLSFDRGDATEIEVEGMDRAEMTYIVRMPGKVTTTSPPAQLEGNKAQWTVKVTDQPQTFTAESKSVRWSYVVLLAYVLLFIVLKLIVALPKLLARIPRKPRKI